MQKIFVENNEEINTIVKDLKTSYESNINVLLKHNLLNNSDNDPNKFDSSVLKFINVKKGEIDEKFKNVNKNNLSVIYNRLEHIIKAISKVNSITILGALEFTDTMAKYGLAYNLCQIGESVDV